MPAGGAEWHVDDRMWALVGVSRPLAAVVVRGVGRAPSLWDVMSKFLEWLSAFLTYPSSHTKPVSTAVQDTMPVTAPDDLHGVPVVASAFAK